MENITATSTNIKKTKKRSTKFNGRLTGVYAVLVFWSLTTFLPLFWVLNNSFKNSNTILSSSITLAKKFDLSNYRTVLGYAKIGKAFFNSFIISGSVVILVLFIGGLASFAIARFNLKYEKWIKAFLYISMLVPQYSVIIPNLMLLKRLNLTSSYLSIIIPQVASNLSLVILLISGYMSSLPAELEEAAIMDGCSIPMIFFKVTVPLSLPIFSTAGIITFLYSYNDLLLSLVYLSDRSKQPICVILSLVSSVFGTNYGALMAAIVVTIVPVLILYAISQEYVIKGLTSGAVKG